MVKGNKQTYNKFADELENLIQNGERTDGYQRKGRTNEQKSFNFLNRKTNQAAAFSQETGELISAWKLDKQGQLEEFLTNNNMI